MSLAFKKATRSATKLRAAFDGPSGSGKTFTSLRLAFGLVQAGLARRVAVIDTEHGSAAKYAGENPDGIPWDFDTLELTTFSPLEYVGALEAAFAAGYDAVVVDSLTHAWSGTGGALDIVDRKAGGGGNKFTAWKDVTPMHNRLIDTIIQAPAHVVATMRSKSEYVLEANDRGKMVPVKKGMAPIQRDGMEYEFDVYGSLDLAHQISISKTRCRLIDGAGDVNPGPRFWRPLFDWLRGDGSAPAPKPTAEAKPNGLPATGSELHRRLQDYDAKLAAQKLCVRGALLSHVVGAGVKAGYPANMAEWAGVAIPFAVDAVKEFEAAVRDKTATPAPGDLDDALEAAGIDYTTAMRHYGWRACGWDHTRDPNPPRVEDLTADQLAHLARLVRENRKPAGAKS